MVSLHSSCAPAERSAFMSCACLTACISTCCACREGTAASSPVGDSAGQPEGSRCSANTGSMWARER